MPEIIDLQVKNGGWLAMFDDGETVFVTHEEINYAGCAQDAAIAKYNSTDRAPSPQTDRLDEMMGDPYDDFVFFGIAPSLYAKSMYDLIDEGDLDADPLPEGRACIGRRGYLDGSILLASAVVAVHVPTDQVLPDTVYVDCDKNYAVVIARADSFYARIDGIEARIERVRP